MKLTQYLHEREKKHIYGGHNEYVATQFSQGMMRLFDEALYDQRIHMVQSPEQLGKTKSADEYVARNHGGRVIKVTLRAAASCDPYGMYVRDLAIAAGMEDHHGRKLITAHYATQALLELCDLVIIDEFHQLEYWPDKSVRALLEHIKRDLHQDGRRGVVLISTNSDIMTLLEAFRRRTKFNLGQILGRMCNEVNDITPEDIPLEDIQLLAGRYAQFHKPTLKRLLKIARKPGLGHFGMVLDILNRCWRDSKLDDIPLTDAVITEEIDRTIDEIEKRPKGLYA